MRSLDDIRADFLVCMEQGLMFTGLMNAVAELERPDGHSMSQHDACMMATRWAIDAGYFNEEDEESVEQAAEQAVSTGMPA